MIKQNQPIFQDTKIPDETGVYPHRIHNIVIYFAYLWEFERFVGKHQGFVLIEF